MKKLYLTVAAACAVASTAANAAIVVDQQQGSALGVSNGSTGIGQSFTAGLDGIDFAQFYLGTRGSSTTAQVRLFDGAGYGGIVLGTSNAISFSDTAQGLYQFDFASRIALTVGSVYTLRIERTGGSAYGAGFSDSNPYSGGNLYLSSGSESLEADLRFAEGIDTARGATAVPEPATWAMMLIGIAAIGGAMRRRKSSARIQFA